MLVDFEVIRKGEAVIDGDEVSDFAARSLAVIDQFLDHQNVGLVPVAVEYTKIKDSDLVDLIHIELSGTQITHNVHILNKLLQRAMFGPQLL